MDRPTDIPPLPFIPTKPPISESMSTVTNRPVPSTSDEPAPTSSEARPTDAPSSSAPQPTSSRPGPTSAPAEASRSDPPFLPSTSETPPPPPPPSSTAERSSQPSSEPTSSPVTSINPPTTAELPPTITSVGLAPTTFTTSPTISSSPLASTTSVAPPITPISTSGLPNSAKLGLAIGLPLVGCLALLMFLAHWLRKRHRNNQENKKKVQEMEEHLQLAAFQSQMAQPGPAVLNRRGSAMFGSHPTRFGDVEQESVQNSQRYQPYSRESNYRGW